VSRLLAALGTVTGVIAITALVIIIGGSNLLGPIVFGFLAFATAVCMLVFSFWLKRRGQLLDQPSHLEYAGYLRKAAFIMLLGIIIRYKLPNVVPGLVAYATSLGTSVEYAANRSALERLVPQPVIPGNALVGANGEALYWWHPCDQPIAFYDREGEHPKGCGQLQPITPAVAQLIERLRKTALAPTAPPLVRAKGVLLDLPRSRSRE
jgi:hypothetical protein